MPRFSTVAFSNVAVTASQDLIALYSGASRTIRLHAIQLAANGQTTVGNYPVRLIRLPTTVTVGSGGTAPTPQAINPNDAAPIYTARVNDTTHATTSGTASLKFADQFNPINGYYWQAPERDAAPQANPSEALVLVLDAVSGTLNVSGTALVEEI